ncbi:hypothetical protein ANCDUO_05387 [Ancylostoma duodenale]|uniref:Hyaluronoglucosaminidase n=1 Tax=Ancylostoma duodenale TaxID=51022 RepID=A0A0C2DNN4_9BILA|nr:hypothetical protein ANCDUO_05387 [Ancylostoma duodenale]
MEKKSKRLPKKSSMKHQSITHWRVFFTKTLEKAIELRPRARWGLYDFPFCNAGAGKDEGNYECSMDAQRYNDK